MKIVICDQLGLCYDGNTLEKQGLGGSESAVILMAKELHQLGFDVTVFNNCEDGEHSTSGVFDGVRYIDNKNAAAHTEHYDIAVVSRTTLPFLQAARNENFQFILNATKRYIWFHDTFIQGDAHVEPLLMNGTVHKIFTLADWHTNYILNAHHEGPRRNYEVLKHRVFQTRNGAVKRIKNIDLKAKDKNHFVYNASQTKGMIPLVEDIWPEVKKFIPDAHLTIIGGFYRFRENAEPDAQESVVQELAKREDLKKLGITFTGVIPQPEIAKILANAYLTIYPAAFPETFGISTLESMLYRTPAVTCRFGALEETATDLASFKIDYAICPNGLFPEIDQKKQNAAFLNELFYAYTNEYIVQQKQNYCRIFDDIAGWDTVALEWKRFFCNELGDFMPIEEHRAAKYITEKVNRVFRRVNTSGHLNEWSKPAVRSEQRIVVISPFWNAEGYIERHIRSVAAQDYTNWFHILIDDNSTDKSFLEASRVIAELDPEGKNHLLVQNPENFGCIRNQVQAWRDHVHKNDLVVFLDGDDELINNPTVFNYLASLYAEGYEMTYGSMWSRADNIPLIAQEYPDEVKEARTYREHLFNWKIPYTHLRTILGAHLHTITDDTPFKRPDGSWMKSGADNPLFYEMIERVEPEKIYCCQDILVNYNDLNPLNDYKINGKEQNQNANQSYMKGTKQTMKKILVAIPTAKYIEVETFKSIWDMDVPDDYEVDFQFFYGYEIGGVRNCATAWALNNGFDFLFFVDSDIVLPKNTLTNLLSADKDIISGVYIQRKSDMQVPEIYMWTEGNGSTNIPLPLLLNNGIVEVVGVGMGCCLINVNVLKEWPQPHFVYTCNKFPGDKGGMSEDVFFCRKARELGFKVWCDTSLKCDHKGSTFFDVDPPALKRYRELAAQPLLPQEHVNYMKSLNLEPKVVYDIGSSVLHWSSRMRSLWPNAKFILFDALENVGSLYEENGFDDYYLGVLGAQVGEQIDFKMNEYHPGGNSMFPENMHINGHSGLYFNDRHNYRKTTNTIDNLASLYDLPKPDVVKIDVQGAEGAVISGALKTFKNVEHFILELQFTDYNIGAPKAEEMIIFMNDLGYKLQAQFTKTNVDGDFHFIPK